MVRTGAGGVVVVAGALPFLGTWARTDGRKARKPFPTCHLPGARSAAPSSPPQRCPGIPFRRASSRARPHRASFRASRGARARIRTHGAHPLRVRYQPRRWRQRCSHGAWPTSGCPPSFGTAGLEQRGARPPVLQVLRARGLELSGHKSLALNAQLLGEADLVLGMARQHVEAAAHLAPHVWPSTLTLKEIVSYDRPVPGRGPESPSVASWPGCTRPAARRRRDRPEVLVTAATPGTTCPTRWGTRTKPASG